MTELQSGLVTMEERAKMMQTDAEGRIKEIKENTEKEAAQISRELTALQANSEKLIEERRKTINHFAEPTNKDEEAL